MAAAAAAAATVVSWAVTHDTETFTANIDKTPSSRCTTFPSHHSSLQFRSTDQLQPHLDTASAGAVDEAVHRQGLAARPCSLDNGRRAHIEHLRLHVQLHHPAQHSAPFHSLCSTLSVTQEQQNN